MPVSVDHIGTAAYPAAVQTDSYVARVSLDCRGYRSYAVTLIASVQDVKWTVYGANASDYSDEVAVQSEATVAAGAVGSYSTTQAPFAYYRAKVKNAAAGVVGTAALQAVGKP